MQDRGCFDLPNRCHSACRPWPTYSPPPCPRNTTTTTKAPATTTKSGDCKTQTICIDKVNSCGMKYGG